MDTARVASWVGVGGSVATLVVLAAPYLLISEPGTGLGVYYTSGLVGVWGAAGQEDRQHRSDPTLTHRPHPHPTIRIRVGAGSGGGARGR